MNTLNMKRSVSCPSLTGYPSTTAMSKSRSSINLCAQALPVDMSPGVVVDNVVQHVQLNGILRAPIHQFDMCLVEAELTSSQILTSRSSSSMGKLREFALCIATPPDAPEPIEVPSTLESWMISRGRREDKRS